MAANACDKANAKFDMEKYFFYTASNFGVLITSLR